MTLLKAMIHNLAYSVKLTIFDIGFFKGVIDFHCYAILPMSVSTPLKNTVMKPFYDKVLKIRLSHDMWLS